MNLFDTSGVCGCGESAYTVYKDSKVLIEKIVSVGYTNIKGFYYDQSHEEWLTLLQGEAVLSYKDGTHVYLSKGDTLCIPAHRCHRIESTSTNPPCIWLCVHIGIEE